MLKLKIKASQITNLTDARYFAAKEVEWLSFNFAEKTDNYIEPMRARAMFDWVEVPHIVGEFDGFDADAVNFYAENWGLKAVQVGESSEIFNLKSDYIVKEIIIDSATYFFETFEQYKAFKAMFKNKIIIITGHARGMNPKFEIEDRIMYDAKMKIFIQGYLALCKGRTIGPNGGRYIIWQNGYDNLHGSSVTPNGGTN